MPEDSASQASCLARFQSCSSNMTASIRVDGGSLAPAAAKVLKAFRNFAE
jgi:hypothetical protein